jgi:putative FmdB family regulatory protein
VPTYAYACSACEHAFDIQQSFSDDALTVCPRCEKESLRKLFSPVGVVFKGSGFYRTDSRAGAKGAGGRSRSSEGGAGPTEAPTTSGGSTGSEGSAGSGTSGGGGTPASGSPAAGPAPATPTA